MDNASLVFSGPERFDKLLSLSSESGKTKRAQFTIPFYLFEGIALSITGYATISEQKKKLPVTIEQAEEIKQVYFKTLYTQIDTGEVLKDPKKEIVKYMRIGEKDQNEQRVGATFLACFLEVLHRYASTGRRRADIILPSSPRYFSKMTKLLGSRLWV